MSIFKKKLVAFSSVLAFITLTGASFAVDSYLGGQATVINKTSNTDISQSGNTLNVNNNSYDNGSVSQVDWGKLGNVSGQEIRFGFSGLSQTIINRVLGGSKSAFYGKLTSGCKDAGCTAYGQTGKVVIINPAGILFGAGSQVDINSLTASTRDFKGAENLTGNKATDDAYVEGLRNATVSGIKYNRYLTFESTGNGTSKIELNGATFDDFTREGGKNNNKTLNLVADNIDYKDSQVKVGDNYNYNGKQSFGRVNLITADGVDFVYLINGYTDSEVYRENANSTTAKTISIDNKNLLAKDPTAETIRTGNVNIVNKGTAKGSDITIANAIIKGTKLMQDEVGNIYVRGERDVNVSGSRFEANNTSAVINGQTVDTVSQEGGEVFIGAGKNVNVSDSLIYSAPTTNTSASAGDVRIFAYDGNVNIDNGSRVFAKGDAEVIATGNVSVADSWIQASNTADLGRKLNVVIKGSGDIDVKNSVLQAANGSVKVQSIDAGNNPLGNINIYESKDGKGKETIIFAKDDIYLWGKNTTVDDALLAYQNLSFYNPESSGLSNVTIKNDTAFSKLPPSGSGFDPNAEITIKTNGNLTLDNASVKRAGYNVDAVRDTNGAIVDDKTVHGIVPNMRITRGTSDSYYGNNVTMQSTNGNVTIQNGSAINSRQTMNVIADNGNVTVDNSTLTTKNAGTDSLPINLTAGGSVTLQNRAIVASSGNTNITAQGGSVNIKDSSRASSTNLDVNVQAHDTITFGANGATGVNIEKSAQIAANKGEVLIKSTAGDINLEKTDAATITYKDRLTFDAKGSNNVTSKDSFKAVKVDYIAGESNNFTTADDIHFVDVNLESKSNNIETTQNGGDVILNNLTVISATDDPAATKTTIIAKGDVTTKDITGTAQSSYNQATQTYAQSAAAGRITQNIGDTVLDINQTKLVVETKAEQTAARPSMGSVDLLLTNADNKNAGIEITAENASGWDVNVNNNEMYNGYNASGVSYGPVVTINSATVNGAKDSIAISKIVTDKLNIVSGNDLIAASVDPSGIKGYESTHFAQSANSSIDPANPKGYIEVRDKGGFNLDYDPSLDGTPDGFTYTEHFNPVTDYGTRVISSNEHYIHFDDKNGTKNPDHDFMLVYNKEVGTYVPDCQELPDVEDKTHTTIDDKEKLNEDDLGIIRPFSSSFTNRQAQQTADIMQASVNAEQEEVKATDNKNDNNDKEDLLK